MLRVAAINFLNPAPLMWDFEHPPLAAALAQRYTLHYTQPSLCADELLAARADQQHNWVLQGDDRGIYGTEGAKLMHYLYPNGP